MQEVKKLNWEVIKSGLKKVLMWFGAIFAAIFAVLFVKENRETTEEENSVIKDDTEEINEKACKKREEAITRINNASARDIAESYSAVNDAIAEGKSRFKKRCSGTDD